MTTIPKSAHIPIPPPAWLNLEALGVDEELRREAFVTAGELQDAYAKTARMMERAAVLAAEIDARVRAGAGARAAEDGVGDLLRSVTGINALLDDGDLQEALDAFDRNPKEIRERLGTWAEYNAREVIR